MIIGNFSLSSNSKIPKFPGNSNDISTNEEPKQRIKTIPRSLIENEQKIDCKYKTELCKKFELTNTCPYGVRCRFAHRKEELIQNTQTTNYKSKKCKRFYSTGICNYGTRCNFQHFEKKINKINLSYYFLTQFMLGLIEEDISPESFKKKLSMNKLEVFKNIEQIFSNSNGKPR